MCVGSNALPNKIIISIKSTCVCIIAINGIEDVDGGDDDGEDVDGDDVDGGDVDGNDVDGEDVDGEDVDGGDGDEAIGESSQDLSSQSSPPSLDSSSTQEHTIFLIPVNQKIF